MVSVTETEPCKTGMNQGEKVYYSVTDSCLLYDEKPHNDSLANIK